MNDVVKDLKRVSPIICNHFVFAGFEGYIIESPYVMSAHANAWRFMSNDHEQLTIITVNLDQLEPGEYAIKNYSENTGMLEALLAKDLIELPHRYVQQGFVSFPIVRRKIDTAR